ncbi:SMI1/KNR4 family protein [Streptomyces sp. NPDC020755]|uniref:SMI1/KNR4 family protein n=1 Tax=Streptomyces sp. NPDC020755 TaxID=3154790 RepID=UPI00340F110A
MTAPISESWTRIENWLAEHAPTTYAALLPPADPADIAATERDIGHPLPRPLVTSLLRHDGLRDQGGELLPGFYRPIGARRIADEWRRLTYYYDRRTAEEIGDDEVDFDFMSGGSSSVLYGHPRLIPHRTGRERGLPRAGPAPGDRPGAYPSSRGRGGRQAWIP